MSEGADKGLEGRIALVIGAGSIASGIGIGRAIAISLAREGANVIAADNDLASAEETVGLIADESGRAEAARVDVLDDDSVTGLISGIEAKHGRLDILNCNVGLGKSGPSEATTPADWRRISDANLTSLHVAAQAAIPMMRAQGGGVITVTSSIASIRHVGYPHLAYSATKAGANQFVRSLAVELAPNGIRVNSIIAGLIDTPRIGVTLANSYGDRTEAQMRATRAAQCPMGRMGSAWDIAEAATFLASDKAGYITGTQLVVDGGLSASIRQAMDA
ncbi:SDR family oxidoreductase [Roseovarius sp. SK2]|jgi:NAD(P)-dependent dehydrogenase (short-subunit alcohol dehydrogenase family)|uniref:SDR family NAD(P)-dependent oxidoreductase n=1 Tax=Roseovarius TaxID=74030 RepID=UPI00237A562D|nr:SDR family oxidoreductase [Roseovarius sp. SK2]MDD9725197.1 SDR family oxidoreductase [Roseovarius sp. SK2]